MYFTHYCRRYRWCFLGTCQDTNYPDSTQSTFWYIFTSSCSSLGVGPLWAMLSNSASSSSQLMCRWLMRASSLRRAIAKQIESSDSAVLCLLTASLYSSITSRAMIAWWKSRDFMGQNIIASDLVNIIH